MGLGLGLGLGIKLGIAFFKDLCDKNAHNKIVNNIDKRIITQHSHSPGGDNFTCNIV